MALPNPFTSTHDTALVDEIAVEIGQDLAQLMERAGAAIAAEAQAMAPNGAILVACGPGNNGGDGYVCARLLAAAGRDVSVWPVTGARSPLCEEQAKRLPETVKVLSAPPAAAPALIVDAILGAGAKGKPREPIAKALTALKALHTPVLAADVPSGLGTDVQMPTAMTVCLQTAKIELLAHPEVPFKVADIGIKPTAYQDVHPNCLRRFPPMKKSGHKGSHGELLVLGGGVFPGALELACRAALMTGCDLVRAWTAQGPKLPSTIVAHRQLGNSLSTADPSELTPLLVRASAVLIGPGLGREPGTEEAAQQAFSLAVEVGVPIIIDADAIAALAETLRNLPKGNAHILITPHRGEARNLLGTSVDEDKLHAFARPDRVVLAKAPVDLITDGRRWQRNHRGNARMAVGGTGDVLAGLSAGLIARGADAFDAGRMAALWICAAADELWQEQGPCYDAESVIARLPATLRKFMDPLGIWPPVSG